MPDIILGHHDAKFLSSEKNSERHKDLFGISDVDYQDLEQDMLERYAVEWG